MAKIIIGNVKGKDGRGITKIVKTASTESVDTYTIMYTDNTTSTFTVNNSNSISIQRQIVPSAAVESSTTASQAYTAGDYVVVGGVLRKVTSSITKGSTIGDSNSAATTVTREIATLRGSVSSTLLYSDTSWRVVSYGRLCIVSVRNVRVSGAGWTAKECPYILPTDKRPKVEIQAAAYAYPNANARIVIDASSGKMMAGSGDGSNIDSTVFASVAWIAGV